HYGHLWVASETTGISYFDKQVNKFKKHIPEHTEDLRHFDFLTDFLVEENGDIWIATQMGLAKYQVADQSYYEYTMPNPSNIQINYGENTFVTSIFKDSQQKLWFTTYGGLNLYHPEGDSLEFFPFEYQVLNLIEKDSNSFWAGSAEGLFTFDKLKKSFSKTLDEPAGIIVKERQGRIWLNAVDYSLGYDPDTNGKILLDQLDGMISDFFWQGHQAGDDYLYFGGTEGMTVFHPDSLPKATQSPRVVLTDFRLFNQTVPLKYSRGDTLDWQSPLTNSITFTKSVELKHWQNYFSFEFAALDFTNPSSNRYQYQLEGYDENWIEAGADRRFVTYTNINPGTYTFKVKAATRNGPWSTEAASVIIHISPPWYRTWWAYLTWGLLFFGLIYTFYRFQLNRRLAEAEATQVKALDEAKTRLYTNITHEFRTPITVILGLADEIQTRSKAQISAIKRNGKQLLQLVNQMLALSKLESGKEKLVLQQADVIAFTKYVVESFQSFAASQQIDVEMSSEIEELMMDYDAEKLQLILSNLIANAIKFTPVGGKVKIVLAKRTQQLHIS
ncbi:MAG: triple tyrosine motif-containing protein, partial [Bacteroidota bacterium]